MEQNTKVIGIGIAGTLLAMLCCLTPVMVVVLNALGFAAYVAKLDYVLVPVFIVSIALVIFGLVRRRRTCTNRSTP